MICVTVLPDVQWEHIDVFLLITSFLKRLQFLVLLN